ncbi:MAG: prolyl oligopeptidase family serine peptidase [Actinomycetota bacterium]|nr:prolyl oligopeptidase family serine peptidase [Actinomycetota bacterium]
MTTLPYGAWPSPVTSRQVAAGGRLLGFPRLVGDEVWWTEGRPQEGGRVALVGSSADGGDVRDVLPAPWSARSRVHEYGGMPWVAVTGPSGPAVVFASYDDQRLFRRDLAGGPGKPLTPLAPQQSGLRYADLVLVGEEVWCVREAHDQDGSVRRHVVAVPLDGSKQVREVAGGSDFLACPRVSPDGRRLTWLAWDHPRMPWDGAEVRVADLRPDGTAGPHRTVLGGPAEAALQPEWADDDTLYAGSDRSGWWNLYRLRADGSGEPDPLCPREEEFGTPLWQLGWRTYGILADGRLAVLHGVGPQRLGVLDPRTGDLHDVGDPDAAWAPMLDVAGQRVAGLTVGPRDPGSIVTVDLPAGAAGAPSVARRAVEDLPDPAYLPEAQLRTLPGGPGNCGREVHVVVWPPRHPDASGPEGTRPPYVVWVHGGPTAHTLPRLKLELAYLTSRGIGVVDVNYGGSTGYGRAYRERLRGQWGVVDVQDCVAAALALAEAEEADPDGLLIQGGSAGGWTTLAALTSTDVFAAGTSYYGVADLLRFAEDTHDFESRYLDSLVGPLPEAQELYVARSPLSHVDSLASPVLLLQGLDDEVVPPSQSELFRDAAARKGIRHAYLAFEGEAHGFRRAETISRCLEAELSFYGQVLGFDPPGAPRLPLSTG